MKTMKVGIKREWGGREKGQRGEGGRGTERERDPRQNVQESAGPGIP